MTSDYYRDLASHPDPARVVGWESRLAQLVRFACVRAALEPGDTVVDLGAGLGDLGRYLAPTGTPYHGLEARPELVSRGLAAPPPVDLRQADAFTCPDAPSATVSVAIGALVDGSPLTDDTTRFTRLRRMFAATLAHASRLAVLVVARQDALPSDPALGGLRDAELAWLLPSGTAVHRLDDLLPTDIVLYVAPRGARLPDRLLSLRTDDLVRSALSHPLAATASRHALLRFALLRGDLPAARALVSAAAEAADFSPDAEWRLLTDRLALAALP